MELLTGKIRVAIAERYYRPSEVDLLIGNPAKAVKLLGWNPQSTTFAVRILVLFQLAPTTELCCIFMLSCGRRSWFVKWSRLTSWRKARHLRSSG